MPEKRMTGTVKWYDAERHYGFILPSYNVSGITTELFVHRDSIVDGNPDPLRKKDIVTYEIGPGKGRYSDRKVAVNVTRIERVSPFKGV